MTNNFRKNEAESKRYRHLMTGYYQFISEGQDPHYLDGMRGFEEIAQKKLKFDLLLVRQGVFYSYEEKLASFPADGKPHIAMYAETESCSHPGRVTPGWMRNSEADFLNYVFEIRDIGLDIWEIDFVRKMKPWFWAEVKKPYRFPHPHRNRDQNQSQGVLIDLGDIARNFPHTRRHLVTFDGKCFPLKLHENIRDAYQQLTTHV